MSIVKYKILIADDEADIVKLLKDYFELQGYLIYTAKDGNEALEKISVKPDIIILDISMPSIDGIEVCKRIRDHISVPIIFLTAKIEENDKIKGFMSGGDDYITKPFGIEELGARITAHLRREHRRNNNERIMAVGNIIISYSERKVYNIFSSDSEEENEKQEIKLTKTEFDIIEILSMNKGQIFSKENIYEKLWGYDKDGNSGIITEHIRRIRNKIEHNEKTEIIETVWGVGYRWTL